MRYAYRRTSLTRPRFAADHGAVSVISVDSLVQSCVNLDELHGKADLVDRETVHLARASRDSGVCVTCLYVITDCPPDVLFFNLSSAARTAIRSGLQQACTIMFEELSKIEEGN